jgi:chemotaxis family two-component system sensor kinase Cph1
MRFFAETDVPETLSADALVSDADLNDCDREPIHIPGAIQPHGFMLVTGAEDTVVAHGAGDIEDITGVQDWIGQPVSVLLGETIAAGLASPAPGEGAVFAGRWTSPSGEGFDVSTHVSGARRIVEVERSGEHPSYGVDLLARLDQASGAFERTLNVRQLAARAADEFRNLTGFERVMIYRFLDDEAGSVLAESKSPEMSSFLNHHFPATDIPKQARALYVRNPVRVIPEVRYSPRPLRPALPEGEPPLDMSDSVLRSVSPIHLQYLRNMEVGSSASISIVTDGVLWGLVACHDSRPRLLTHETRIAATALARGLARQIKAKGDAELYRERVRLRGLEDELVARLPLEEPLDAALASHLDEVAALVGATGAAVLRGKKVSTGGVCPPSNGIVALGNWVAKTGGGRVMSTAGLSEIFPAAVAWRAEASGFMAFVIAGDEPFVLMWFRAEKLEVVRWAGDPHTAVKTGDTGKLTPRASFEEWTETVSGNAQRWTNPEIESAGRFRDALFELRALRQMRAVNQTLQESVADRDLKLEHQDFLLREVNHRVQNSLQLITSFLSLQARDNVDARPASEVLKEAQRRVKAVSLVHSRLYRADQFETIDLGRYFSELIEDMANSSGQDWAALIHTELAPISIEAGRATTFGLILTELIINAQKYAYGGRAGPLYITLEEDRGSARVIVADEGVGGHQSGKGFGSRLIESLAGQLGAAIEYRNARPGLRVIMTAPIG